MSNSLQRWIENSGYDEIRVMNVLQKWMVISDNCVWAKDCGNDVEAMMWLSKNIDKVRNINLNA